jgi:hypothetical protein
LRRRDHVGGPAGAPLPDRDEPRGATTLLLRTAGADDDALLANLRRRAAGAWFAAKA